MSRIEWRTLRSASVLTAIKARRLEGCSSVPASSTTPAYRPTLSNFSVQHASERISCYRRWCWQQDVRFGRITHTVHSGEVRWGHGQERLRRPRPERGSQERCARRGPEGCQGKQGIVARKAGWRVRTTRSRRAVLVRRCSAGRPCRERNIASALYNTKV
ncbi:uncharacterized protein B0H18DRAFT_35595 [Fomitopsis serialis]|uniref:uncharacterized protein n=1 Tax=Fomitopsis serialis TaxID=139415 RepID=UPI0020072829|nr:uncharacterized protein B0H18DRAFT_35595 [Neoantrodia serialis]KAH9917504.1 hypothetical protein B0H18DRAFT_35595 [Neoantrodia serialis]